VAEVILYQYGGTPAVPSFSPPCLKVYLALRRLGLPHRVVDLTTPLHVRRLSPTGRVPVISVDGEIIADSVFILDRLEELHPEAALWPDDAGQRVADRLWDCFATDTLYWQGFYLRWLVPENRKKVLDAAFGSDFSFKKLAVDKLGRWELGKRARGQGIGGRSRGDVEASFRSSMAMIERGMGTGPFLQSRTMPGRGDLAVAAHLAQLTLRREEPGEARMIAMHPLALAQVAATFEACGLPAP
jgi:glutathione S-transferase